MSEQKRRPLVPVSVEDYRVIARRNLPRMLFDYIDGGSYDEFTINRNREAFRRTLLRQRVLIDVSDIRTGVTLLGEDWTFPVGLAPVGFAGMFARRAEVQAARAARKLGVPWTLSTVGISPLEEIARRTKAPFWFQLYMLRDRGFVKAMLERAQAAGVSVLVFTVDLAVLGVRYRDVRNGMGGGLNLGGRLSVIDDYIGHLPWVWNVAFRGRPLSFGNLRGAVKGARGLADFKKWVDAQFDPSFTWADLEWVRANWPGKLVIKGVMDAEDAKAAMKAVAPEGIVVSNHGGRQLDGVPAPLEVLPSIRDAVGGETCLLMDGGVRTGIDVLKALARGADGCMIGKAWAYAVAAGGQEYIIRLLRTMQSELRVAMALTGVTRPESIDRRVLVAD